MLRDVTYEMRKRLRTFELLLRGQALIVFDAQHLDHFASDSFFSAEESSRQLGTKMRLAQGMQ